jgi:hypothetical protein
MNLDWLTILLPVVNAAGIPILAFAVIMLVRAYRKSVETYKETADHLRLENDRLRKRLSELDTGYSKQLDRIRNVVDKAVGSLEHLNGRRVALLSNLGSDRQATMRDVMKISEAIDAITPLIQTLGKFSPPLIARVIEEYLNRLAIDLGKLAAQIGDSQSRLALIKIVVTSDRVLRDVESDVAKTQRGLTIPSEQRIELPGLDIEKLDRFLSEILESGDSQTARGKSPGDELSGRERLKRILAEHSSQKEEESEIKQLSEGKGKNEESSKSGAK